MKLRALLPVVFLPAAAIAAGCSSGTSSTPASTQQGSASPSLFPRALPSSLHEVGLNAGRRLLAKNASTTKTPPATSLDGGTSSQPPARCRRPNDPVPKRYRELVRTFESDLANTPPGAAMAVLEHGRLAFAYAGGTKGPNSTEPVCPSSLFRIGSMTKAMTAVALLHLVDEGKASLDEKVIDIEPDVTLPAGPDFSSLTMRQMLSMQSGLVDIVNFFGPTDDASLAQYLTGPSFAQSVFFMDPPGSFWDYSSTNYMLAGLGIERLGGLSYRDAIRRHVTKPLGMDRTVFLPSEVLADGDYTNALSSNADGSPWDVAPDAYDNAALRPAGMAFSSVLDFAKFVELIDRGDEDVLSRKSWRAIQAPQINTDTSGTIGEYGLGIGVSTGTRVIHSDGSETYFPGRRLHHGGGTLGWTSDWEFFPETGFGIILFWSSDQGSGFGNTLNYAFEHLAHLAQGTPPVSLAVDPSRFPAYAGSYYDPNQAGSVIVTDTNGTLTISMPQVDALGIPYDSTLVPFTRDNFAFTFAGIYQQVTFIPDASGKFVWFRALQDFVARRVSDGDAGAPADAAAE